VLDSALPVLVPELLPEAIRNPSAHDTGIEPILAGRPPTSHSAAPVPNAVAEQLIEEETDDVFPVSVPPISEDVDTEEPSGRALPHLVDRLFQEKSTDMYSEVIAYAERYLLLRVLRETDGNQSKAATILGITRGKLRDRIATYDIRLESGVKIGE
jgi:two-component system nitrogen regulation response regulator GlnG